MRFGWVSRAGVVAAAAVVAALALVRLLPVYFRADDALYLEWASNHTSPLDAFMRSQATIVGVFRPLQSLTWWSLWRVFGLRPEPYQTLVTLLFLACLALVVRLARRLFSAGGGWWSLVAFLGFFPYLASVVFWFSDLSFLLESVLMLAAVNFLVEAFAGRIAFAWAVGAYLLAMLAKEPATIIVPAAAAALLLADWRVTREVLRQRGAVVVAGLAAAGAAVALLHPSLRERQGTTLGGGWAALAGFAGERWDLYAAQILGGAGSGLVALAILAVWLRLRPRDGRRALTLWVPVVAALIAAVLLKRAPGFGLAVMVVCLLGQVVLRRREGVGVAWFVVPLLGLLTISFAVRTYLFEAAFGLALVAGATLDELAREAWADLRRMRRPVVAVLAGTLALTLTVTAPRLAASVGTKLAALELVSAARLNFRDAVGTLLDPSLPAHTVVVVDYADMGLDYVRDIVPLADVEKARRQKTMMSHEVAAFLKVAGRRDTAVVTLSEFLRLPAGTRAVLVVMNGSEEGLAERLGLRRELVAGSARRGEIARVYRVMR